VFPTIQLVGWSKPSLAQNKGTSLVLLRLFRMGKYGSGRRTAESWKLTWTARGTPSFVLISMYMLWAVVLGEGVWVSMVLGGE